MRADKAAMQSFAIGALSRRTGCNVETIRYYERIGLLEKPARSASGYRLYGPRDVQHLHFIRQARALGFTIDEIRELLRLSEGNADACATARNTASTHLESVRTKIANLRSMEKVLAKTLARCESGNNPACPLIEVLASRSTG